MLRRILMLSVGMGFLASVGIALAPLLPRDGGVIAAASEAQADPSMSAPQATDARPGRFAIVERPDLRPFMPRNPSYESPLLAGVMTHETMVGMTPRRWQVYAPPSHAASPRPVILLFHGANRDGMSMIHMWKQVADAHDLVLIGLNAPPGGWNVTRAEGRYLQAVLDHAAAEYAIDRGRMFLFGHSAGSIMAQVVANRVHGPWRGVVGHAGTVNPGWLSPIADAPPVRHYLGTADHIFGVDEAIMAGEIAAEAGHDHTLVLIPGHTHWFYVGGPTFAADAWAWFATL